MNDSKTQGLGVKTLRLTLLRTQDSKTHLAPRLKTVRPKTLVPGRQVGRQQDIHMCTHTSGAAPHLGDVRAPALFLSGRALAGLHGNLQELRVREVGEARRHTAGCARGAKTGFVTDNTTHTRAVVTTHTRAHSQDTSPAGRPQSGHQSRCVRKPHLMHSGAPSSASSDRSRSRIPALDSRR